MNKLTRVFVCALLSLLSVTGLAQRPSNTIDAYATFSEMYANAPVGGCGCFWMNGGLEVSPFRCGATSLRSSRPVAIPQTTSLASIPV